LPDVGFNRLAGHKQYNKEIMKIIKGFFRLVSASAVMIVLNPLMVSAATTNVLVGAGGTLTFSPKIVSINTGDTIIWTWQGNFHSTTSGTLSGTPPTATANPDGIWDSGVFNQPHSFTNSFPTAGTFPFYCSLHFNSSMTGQVDVAQSGPKMVTVFVGNTNLVGTAADVFVPPVTNANVGDQVVWVWQGSFHSTTSGTNGTASGLWDSGVNSPVHSFTNTFTSPGSFLYYCSVHFSLGMTGAVNIAGAIVSITNPVNNATFSAPASFTLAATASSLGGTVTNVEFFQGAASLGNATTAPYTFPVNNLAAADYTFSAVAADNSGFRGTNSITVHVVTPVAIVLSSPQFFPPGDFRFNYTANPGLSYIVQRTSSLSSGSWTTLVTNVAGSSPVLFDDPAASGNPGYYRVGRLPNP